MFASKDALFAKSSGGYQISRSLRFRSSASAYLSRTPASAGNRKTWTWSGWVKRGTIATNDALFHVYGSATTTTYFLLRFDSTNSALYAGNSATNFFITTQLFRDPSAWYHIVLTLDTTQAAATDRLKLYVNGQQVTSFSSDNRSAQITQNSDQGINQAAAHSIGRENSGTFYADGYLAEVNFIDGQALTPSSFGAFDTNGVWQPARYTGSYGTNGFYLNFSDNSGATATTIGKDSSGNSNNWTPNNISVTSGTTYDSMIDSPTNYADGGNGRGNYAVLNPLLFYSTTTPTLSNGNLTAAWNNTSMFCGTTMACPNGSKTYAEFTLTTANTTRIGIKPSSNQTQYGGGWTYVASLGAIRDTSDTQVQTVATSTNGDIIGIAVDLVNNTIQFYKNGSTLGTAITIANGNDWVFWIGQNGSGSSIQVDANFGQRPFTYTPPSGFSALNTQNLPTPTIANGAQYMAATTYTGTGATQQIYPGASGVSYGNNPLGTSFQPDFVWLKSRSNPRDHRLMDSVRGINLVLSSDLTAAEYAGSALSSLNANGFTLNTTDVQNVLSETYVGWNWNAGGAPTTDNVAGVGNVPTAGSVKINGANSTSTLAGSIAATRLSANTSAGFSVVTYISNGVNGATIGHGLGVAPSLVIVKCRYTGTTQNWAVYHSSIGATQYLLLNSTAAAATSATYWNNTAPDSSKFTIGTNNDVNINSSVYTYVAYCFAPVAGYSAFGNYTGNASTDGPFVYTGFRPRYLLIKSSSNATGWVLLDAARNTYNVANNYLWANLSDAEAQYDIVDFLSNGFKIRAGTGTASNASGSYIYAAFAENPFKYSRAR